MFTCRRIFTEIGELYSDAKEQPGAASSKYGEMLKRKEGSNYERKLNKASNTYILHGVVEKGIEHAKT